MELKDKVIVVTGAGRGIGRALCTRFARESPAVLVVADIDAQLANELAAEVAPDVQSRAVHCDVACESDIQQMVQDTQQEWGRIDLFCANAGIAWIGSETASNEDWRRVMDVNFMSHVYSARAVLPGMLARGKGYFLHTASAAGLLTAIGSAPYAVSKHAAVAFAEWLAMTYGDQGVKVSCLCPQGVWTDMIDNDHPAVKLLQADALTPEAVADCCVDGLRQEHFLILPHPEVATFFQNKANNYDRWLAGMRKIHRQL